MGENRETTRWQVQASRKADFLSNTLPKGAVICCGQWYALHPTQIKLYWHKAHENGQLHEYCFVIMGHWSRCEEWCKPFYQPLQSSNAPLVTGFLFFYCTPEVWAFWPQESENLSSKRHLTKKVWSLELGRCMSKHYLHLLLAIWPRQVSQPLWVSIPLYVQWE